MFESDVHALYFSLGIQRDSLWDLATDGKVSVLSHLVFVALAIN